MMALIWSNQNDLCGALEVNYFIPSLDTLDAIAEDEL